MVHWFSVYREDGGQDDRYVFKVNPKDGLVSGWNADTGKLQKIY